MGAEKQTVEEKILLSRIEYFLGDEFRLRRGSNHRYPALRRGRCGHHCVTAATAAMSVVRDGMEGRDSERQMCSPVNRLEDLGGCSSQMVKEASNSHLGPLHRGPATHLGPIHES